MPAKLKKHYIAVGYDYGDAEWFSSHPFPSKKEANESLDCGEIRFYLEIDLPMHEINPNTPVYKVKINGSGDTR